MPSKQSTDELQESYRSVLTAFRGLSVTGIPVGAENALIIGFIVEKFKDFTMEEVAQAVKMYSAKEFPEVESHFSRITCEWLGSLLSAYRTKRNELMLQRLKDVQKPKELEQSEILKQRLNNFNKGVFIPYAMYCETDIWNFTGEEIWYDSLNEMRLLTWESKEEEIEIKKDFLVKAESNLTNKMTNTTDIHKRRAYFKQIATGQKHDKSSEVYTIAKQMTFRHYIDLMKSCEFDLKRAIELKLNEDGKEKS